MAGILETIERGTAAWDERGLEALYLASESVGRSEDEFYTVADSQDPIVFVYYPSDEGIVADIFADRDEMLAAIERWAKW